MRALLEALHRADARRGGTGESRGGKDAGDLRRFRLDEANAAYAPQSLLWELDLDDPNKALDEAVAERRAACELVAAGELQKQQCLLSAAGHPNVAGAAKMAEQCISVAAAARSVPAAG